MLRYRDIDHQVVENRRETSYFLHCKDPPIMATFVYFSNSCGES